MSERHDAAAVGDIDAVIHVECDDKTHALLCVTHMNSATRTNKWPCVLIGADSDTIIIVGQQW